MNLFKVIAYILLSLPLFIPQIAKAQTHPIEDQIFNQINEIGFTDNGHLIVLKEKGDYLVHVLNPETFEVEQKLVRRGKGPGELLKASTYYIDQENNIIYLAGFDKRVIGVSISNGELLFEKTFTEIKGAMNTNQTPSMIIKDGHLFMSNSGRLDPSQPAESSLPVVSIFDTSSAELIFNFELTNEQLAFPNLDDLTKANAVPLSTELLLFSDRLSLITIKGLPYFYFFVNGEFRKRVELNPDFEVSFITSTREEFGSSVGIKVPAYINNAELLDENKVLISYGNIHQEEISLGYSIYQIDHTLKPGLQDRISVKLVLDQRLEEIEGVSEFNITPYNGKLFMHNNYYWLASEIYVVEVPDLNSK